MNDMMISDVKTYKPTRRCFLGGLSASALAGFSQVNAGEERPSEKREGPVRAARPKPPYRVWFQPRLFDRDIDLYENMTIDASGWLDPRLAEAMGKSTLDWVYGLQHPWADGPGYWKEACSPEERRRGSFTSAGIAIDEWVPPKLAKNPEWLAEGLRAGRRLHPDVFIAVWITDPTPPLFQLVRDGTVDLIIVEGYTHHAPDVPANLTTSWEGAIRRVASLAEAELLEKTIFSFGHIAAGAQRNGGRLTEKWLRERAEELTKRFPKMPGVAFFQRGEDDSPEFRELIRACDKLSGELWPDNAS